MAGYTWTHKCKLVPSDGVDEVIAIASAFTDLEGPSRTKVDVRHEQETRTDINHIKHQDHFGFRYRLTVRFEILDLTDHANLVQIMNAFADEHTQVFWSLDDGETYYEVNVLDAPSPRPIRNVTAVGATFDLKMETAELIDEMVAIPAW